MYCVNKLWEIQTLNAGVEKIHRNAVEKIATYLPSFGFLLESHIPNAMPRKSKVGENTIAVMYGLSSESITGSLIYKDETN